jgi:dephospho-CoA kinase|tara:strand:+ start:148 stop:843 length:696 start_codon:yes stop_codon:yes gene_type:complete
VKTFEQLTEGVYDPNIFKAFFLAGGPGSGKSYVVRRTTGGLGLKIVNSDIAFEKLLNDADFDLDFRAMSPEKSLERDKIRSRAKEITSKMQRNFVAGRLGLIIDGTGAEYVKIERQARKLKELGYETYMIFVNTSLDTAIERNNQRSRKLPLDIVKTYWNNVQANIGKFQRLFGMGNMIIVDNNSAGENVFNTVFKQIVKLTKRKVKNYIAKQWIDNQLRMKRVMGALTNR